MPATPFQPIIPTQPPQVSEAEFNFMEDSPPEFFPDNPESNFGLKRRLWTTQMQEIIDQLNLTYLERFPTSSTQFIDEWEITVGLPVGTDTSEAGIAARRNRVVSRLRKSAFTDELIRQVVEGFIAVTFGAPLMLTVPGVEIPVGGLTLYGEGGNISSTYRVYHDIENFSYTVYIRSDITPDIVGLSRELTRITPAGISFTIDNSKANVLDYTRAIKDDGPTAYWKLGANFNNSTSLTGLNGTASGGAAAGGGAALAQNATDASTDFNGTSQVVTITSALAISPAGAFSLEAWVRPDVADNAQRTIMRKEGGYLLDVNSNQIRFGVWKNSAVVGLISSTISITANTTYHLAVTYDGLKSRLYVNGVLNKEADVIEGPVDAGGNLGIGAAPGGSTFWDGRIDEAVLYNYMLSPEQILAHYKTGINVA